MRDFTEIEFHRTWLLPFYDRYLKGQARTSYDDRPDVEYAVKNTGETRTASSWPPAEARDSSYYLSAGPSGSVASLNDGALLSHAGGASGESRYTYPHPSWVLGVVALGPSGPTPRAAC